MMRFIFYGLILGFFLQFGASAQTVENNVNLRQLRVYQDSLKSLGNKFINDDNDLIRRNANYTFIKTLVSALKIHDSFHFPFDSVKTITILNAPDNKFRIFSWHVMNNDGSYRFYGAIQMNSTAALQLYPLEDYSPLLKNPEDSVTDNKKWYGAQYYKMIQVNAANPYYVVLGWKGYTIKSTKKVIDVVSFKNGKLVLGAPVFAGNGKTRSRVVFEYTRQASMLLKVIPERSLIVFDHLAPPEPALKDHFEAYGPDMSYNGYKLTNDRWMYVDNLDMRNIPSTSDEQYIDPKAQAELDKAAAAKKKKT